MAGHSKWKNIMHRKGKNDAQKGKIFTKIGKEITMAVKAGGGDPSVNGRLKDLIAKAKSNNVPNDSIERTIKKALGSDDINYEEITYEGYGPGGIAVIVEATTDNRNRTGGDIRWYFDKNGGNMGATGCVSYMFGGKGVIIIEKGNLSEDKVMEDALEAGAEDFSSEEGVFEILAAPGDFSSVRENLEELGYKFLSAEIEKIPDNYISVTDEEIKTKMEKLLDMLDDNDDVVNVWHNME